MFYNATYNTHIDCRFSFNQSMAFPSFRHSISGSNAKFTQLSDILTF